MVSFKDSLDAQHGEIGRRLERVVQAARAADWPAYRLHFGTLREGLRAHMAFEEEALFPVLDKAAPAAVRERRAEHAEIAAQVDTLGAASPQHDPEGCIAVLEQLGALLRAHHAAEMALDPQYATRPIPSLVRREPPVMDLRGLQPPEPIVRIFAALERSPDEPLRVILPHEPVPLYGLLRERGFRYSGASRAEGGFELLIDRAG
jgi:Uncharacterized conserved protein (DUF2249)/Hemerythrin HHE cation binding domain